jgi:hypothetical protein
MSAMAPDIAVAGPRPTRPGAVRPASEAASVHAQCPYSARLAPAGAAHAAVTWSSAFDRRGLAGARGRGRARPQAAPRRAAVPLRCPCRFTRSRPRAPPDRPDPPPPARAHPAAAVQLWHGGLCAARAAVRGAAMAAPRGSGTGLGVALVRAATPAPAAAARLACLRSCPTLTPMTTPRPACGGFCTEGGNPSKRLRQKLRKSPANGDPTRRVRYGVEVLRILQYAAESGKGEKPGRVKNFIHEPFFFPFCFFLRE